MRVYNYKPSPSNDIKLSKFKRLNSDTAHATFTSTLPFESVTDKQKNQA